MSFSCQVAVPSEWLVALTLIQQRLPHSGILFIVGDHRQRATHYSQLNSRSILSVVRNFRVAKYIATNQRKIKTNGILRVVLVLCRFASVPMYLNIGVI